jgi:hypothetical protein
MPNSKAYGEATIENGSTGLNSHMVRSTMWKDFMALKDWDCKFKSYNNIYWHMASSTF